MSGIVTNYHRIESINFRKEGINIAVDSYVDYENRNKNKIRVFNKNFWFAIDLTKSIGDKNALTYGYELLKQKEEFKDALNV